MSLLAALQAAIVAAQSDAARLEPGQRQSARTRHAVLTIHAIEKRLERSLRELDELNEEWHPNGD